MVALLGISTYQAQPAINALPSLGDKQVEERLAVLRGQLSALPQTQLRWYLADLESALRKADAGDLLKAGELWAAMKRDGTLAGILSTRCSGLVHLPKRMSGRADIVADLEGRDGVSSKFDAMFPATELEKIAEDGIGMGVAVGVLAPVEGRAYPVLVRLDPRWLSYRWGENRWYYNSVVGTLPITPGDGHWVLWTFGGRIAPWQSGLWYSLGTAWVNKQHAMFQKANWEAKLANPARAAVAPIGATENQRQGFFQRLIAWGANTVFDLPIGWDVKIIESNGIGHKSFDATIERSDVEFAIGIAGQVVTVTGGTGFANADVHKSIRADLIQSTGEKLAYGLNTQGIPPYVLGHFGEDALAETAVTSWDTTPPKDLKADAEAQNQLGNAIKTANDALAPYGLRVEVKALASRFGLPLERVDGTSLAEEGGVVDEGIAEAVVDEEDELDEGAAPDDTDEEDRRAA